MSLIMMGKGFAFGLAVAAPVGPIGLLCIRRTLAQGRAAGLCTGLGAASADAVYGLIAAFGLTGLAGLAAGPTPWLKTAGGLFLIGLGLAAILKKTPDRVAEATSGRGLAWAWASTFALTLTNPMTIISFAAVFAGLGLAEQAGSPAAAWMLVAGVFLGSAGWWLVLSGGVGLLRGRLSDRLMLWVNRLAGIFILAFGCWALVESWLK